MPLTVRASALAAACALAAGRLEAQRPPASGAARDTAPIAITGVTVIDVETGRRLPLRTVVIRGSRIAAVGTSHTTPVPAGARVFDGRGRFLIPGLWDMHVHTLPRAQRPQSLRTFFPLFVANGVTGVRDMGGIFDTLRAMRGRGLGDLPAAPRLVAAGPIVDGPRPTFPDQSVAVAAAADAAMVVDSLAAAGAEFIKVYSRLPRDSYLAIAAAARRRGIPFAGHVPVEVSVAEASDAGQRSMEHLAEFIVDCSADATTIRGEYAAAIRDAPAGAAQLNVARRTARARALQSVDWARCRALAGRLARNGMWVTTTLIVGTAAVDTTRPHDQRLRYFEPATLSAWLAVPRAAAIPETVRPAADDSRARPIRVEAAAEYVRVLHRAGVRILAGTDAPGIMTFPGFDLHGELAQLVRAGLSPLDALRAATSNPARFLQATDSLGAVARGKLADLVVLDADPLTDIVNTTRVHAVVLDGRLLDRAALDSLLAGVARVAGAPAGR